MQLVAFPAERVIHPERTCHARPGDLLAHTPCVIVTEGGMSRVYDSRADLHAAVLVAENGRLRAVEKAYARYAVRRFANRVRVRQGAAAYRFAQELLTGLQLAALVGACIIAATL